MVLRNQKQNHFLTATFAVLFVLLGSTNAHAQSRCAEIFSKSATRTEVRNDFITTNAFTVNRTLVVYSQHFPFKTTESLKDTVEQLPQGSVWVDMGAGEARALVDGLKSNPRISEGVAIAYKKPAGALSGADVTGRFRYLDGDFVENMNRDGKLDSLKGRADLVTDVFGPISYSEHLPPLLQTYLDLLRPNGTAVFNVMAERSFDRPTMHEMRLLNEPMALNPVLMNGRPSADGLVAWLKTIPGIEVVEVGEYKVTDGQYWEKSFAIKVRKVGNDVIVPDTLKTVSYQASSPPKRTFEIVPDQARRIVIPLRRNEDFRDQGT